MPRILPGIKAKPDRRSKRREFMPAVIYEVHELRKAGKSWKQIGEHLGYKDRHKAIERAYGLYAEKDGIKPVRGFRATRGNRMKNTISVHLPDEDYDRLLTICHGLNKPVSHYLRELVLAHLKGMDP